MKRTLLLLSALAGALTLSVDASAAPSPSPVLKGRNEHVSAPSGPVQHRASSLQVTDAMPSPQQLAGVRTAQPAATASSVAPFLTRPYWDPHTVTSIFDHCNPDYTLDGRLCEYDGTVALRSNGHDPTFSSGYPITPGGTDYLYYDGHNGWDLALNYEPLMAAADGVVNIAGSDPYNPGFGLTVTIDHPNGITTRYAHMSSISVSSGQSVKRGQGIGVSGNTGASTGAHLHFGVYVTSTWTAIDPWGWTGSTPDPWPSDVGNLWLLGNPQNPVPLAPGTPSGTAGDGLVNLTWSAPSFDGGDGIARYKVTAQPGGQTWTVAGGATSGTLTGLANFQAYTFTVTATNGAGYEGPASAASAAITPVPGWPGRLHTVTPSRILDTRIGQGGSRLGPDQGLSLAVAGDGIVPATGASAVVLNLTATNVSQPTYVTVAPTPAQMKGTSSLNVVPGDLRSNEVVATLGGDGRVQVYNSAGSVDVIADVVGWFSNAADTGAAGHVLPLAPARVLDTRRQTLGIGTFGPNTAASFQVTGQGGVPAAVSGVVVNLTAVNATDFSYFVAWGGTATRPLASNLVFAPWGGPRAVRAIVPVGADGMLHLYNAAGRADLLVDVVGYVTDGSATPGSSGLYTGVLPYRALDTRTTAPLAGGHWLDVPLTGTGLLPASARLAVLNVAVTDATDFGFLAVLPSTSPPSTSDINFGPGSTVANLVVATLDGAGHAHIYCSAGTTNVLVDVAGWAG